ncbi:class I adenylate-forming enzyme family protein [Aeromicrobium choanae]|uniref:Acyl-CoA synthetase (AMP-forming)/AMP-acid ligase II n=1 Tax=Aeromicrobium choanae TaxID=1736691 RepID=A0A1T4YSY0_9ACTN|nr:class I adenylate-forming enzyme family protein [Aeromicrobium choanae]SKB04977.1 Acyl-CoA synthetase (AMP-forming)/AMP-acid ligase II [Aeromicrobium choanae]
MTGASFADLLRWTDDPQRVAVIDGETTLTRGELFTRAFERAEHIAATVPADERVALSGAGHEAVVDIVAVLLSGRSLVMLPRPTPERTRELAARSRCRFDLSAGALEPFGVEPSADPRHHPADGIEVVGSPEALLLFTSGTTSEPKGVRLSSRNVACNVTAVNQVVQPWDPDEDVLGFILDPTHSYGFSMVLLALMRSVPLLMTAGTLPSRPLAELLDHHGVTILPCVPYYLRLVARRFSLGEDFAPALRMLLLAGGGVSDASLAELTPGFHGGTHLMYGLTEATARVAVRPLGSTAPADSVGLPLPGTTVDLVDADGRVTVGGEGRLRVTGPSVFMGYLGDPVREPGTPLVTTDLGRMDAHGHLTVTGRLAEMINFRGNRVSAVAVEAEVARVDGVAGALLLADDTVEDAQCSLFVELAPDADREGLTRRVLAAVDPRGLVREVVVVDRLQTTRTGKLVRRRPAGA